MTEIELLLREAIEACDHWIENDYGIAIMCCCGAADMDPEPHEPDCWLVRAKKLLGIE